MGIKVATASDTWQVMKTRPQMEHECGIRMAMYMIMFRTWAMADTQPNEIYARISRLVGEEKADKDDLAKKYRKQLHGILKDEIRKIEGGTV